MENIIEVVFGGFPEESGMLSANRFQTDDRTLERERGVNVQRRRYRIHSAFLCGLRIISQSSRNQFHYLASWAGLRHLNYDAISVEYKTLTGDDLLRPIRYEHAVPGVLPVKAQCLPFSLVPHTTRLFLDFLSYSPNVRPFYPHSPHFNEGSNERAAALQYDSSRREQVSAILEQQNAAWGAGAKTLANIKRLRNGAAAVVTGQQVGLFGGPMFAIYKALTAVKLAEEATAAGVDAVPIFWLATSDHDLAEVNHVSMPGADGALQTVTTTSHDVPAAPVSAVRLGDEILPAVEQAVALLGESEATQILRESYRPGETLGTAYARFYARLFAEWGVILLDASDSEFHRVAEPIYRSAIENAAAVNTALLARGHALEAARYHQQVKVAPSTVLLFALKDGARTPIHRLTTGDAEFVIGHENGAEKLSKDALL